jgi:hypothetical protein
MEWHLCMMGEWSGPFTIERIRELTETIPNLILMAGGGDDAGLRVLEKDVKVLALALMVPGLTAAAVDTLRTLPRLQELILCGPPITDDLLLRLAALKGLRDVTLIHTACTAEGVRRFLDAAPGCNVYRGGANCVLPVALRKNVQPFLAKA